MGNGGHGTGFVPHLAQRCAVVPPHFQTCRLDSRALFAAADLLCGEAAPCSGRLVFTGPEVHLPRPSARPCRAHVEERLMNLSRAYDHWHQEVFDSAPAHPDESSPWDRLVLEYLGAVENKRILEVGCGRGGFSRLLASRGAHIVGADFSISALRIGQQKLREREGPSFRAVLAQADPQNLPFASNSFLLVVS